MEIKFLRDYRGKETREAFFLAGSITDVRDDDAQRLIALGFAVSMDAPAAPIGKQDETLPEAAQISP